MNAANILESFEPDSTRFFVYSEFLYCLQEIVHDCEIETSEGSRLRTRAAIFTQTIVLFCIISLKSSSSKVEDPDGNVGMYLLPQSRSLEISHSTFDIWWVGEGYVQRGRIAIASTLKDYCIVNNENRNIFSWSILDWWVLSMLLSLVKYNQKYFQNSSFCLNLKWRR